LPGQATDRVAVHPGQPCRLANATSLVQMFQHREALFLRELRSEQGCPLALAEAALAGPATQQQPTLVRSVTGTDIEIAVVAFAVERALGVQTTETREVFHDPPPPPPSPPPPPAQLGAQTTIQVMATFNATVVGHEGKSGKFWRILLAQPDGGRPDYAWGVTSRTLFNCQRFTAAGRARRSSRGKRARCAP